MSSGHLFPRFHVRPPHGYLNDPNGPVLLDGTYHLFFQCRYTTDHESPVMWGHATSEDLVHWVHHRAAISPHPLLGDRDGCYSGNTVLGDDGRLRAFYSGRRVDHPYESVLCAVSVDRGASFGDPVQVVPDPGPEDSVITFRDPFVWRDGDRWLMVVGAGDASGVASARLYGSPDLETWASLGPLARHPREVDVDRDVDTGEMWECPQVFVNEGAPVLVVGAWSRIEGTMRVYAVTGGSTDGAAGDIAITPVDDGPDFYAASVLPVSPHGTLMWGWAREARIYAWCVEDGWSGALTLPRVVTVGLDGRLRQSPGPGLEALRLADAREVGDEGVGHLPAQLEIQATARPGGVLRLRVRFGPDEHLDVVLDADQGTVAIDRDHASQDPRASGGVSLIRDAFTDAASVRIFLDGSLLELFTSAGHAATVRCYPTTPPPWSLEVSGAEGDSVRVWSLRAGQGVLDSGTGTSSRHS